MGFDTLSGKRKRPKEDADFLQTPPIATRGLLSVEKFEGKIWEPACGKGAISRELVIRGYEVLSTDLYDYGYHSSGIDFLEDCKDQRVDNIITNPPFNKLNEFIDVGLQVVTRKLALLVKVPALTSSYARSSKLARERRPSNIWCFEKKIPYMDAEGNERASIFAFCWVVWNKTQPCFTTTLGWIPKEEKCPVL